MVSGIAEKEAAAIRAFSGTFLLGCRKGREGWEVWSDLGPMRYQLGTVDTLIGEVVYRPSKPSIYRPPTYLLEFAVDVARKTGLRIVD